MMGNGGIECNMYGRKDTVFEIIWSDGVTLKALMWDFYVV